MQALIAIYTIWLREVKVFAREKSRTIGMIVQPLLYLFIVGAGITSAMNLRADVEGIDFMKFMYPGIIGMSVLFTSIISGVSIIWDREFGFLKEVLVAPVPRWSVAAGKILGGATVATLQSVILVLLAPVIGIELTAWILIAMCGLSFLMSFVVTSLGVMIAARMQSMQGFQIVMNFIVMPMYFLSGAIFPLDSAPAVMRTLMVLDPLTYGVDAIRAVVFSGTIVDTVGGARVSLAEAARQAGLVQWSVGFDVLVMVALGLALGFLSSLRFNRAE